MRKLAFLFALLFVIAIQAQRDFSKVEITSEKLSDNIYVLFGSGGNIGLAIGEDNA